MRKTSEPTKRIPNFTGVPGQLVDEPEGLTYGASKSSPYDPLLNSLVAATDKWNAEGRTKSRPVLKFSDLKAKSSVYSRSQKLKIRVTFCEGAGSCLYVRYEGKRDEALSGKRRENILTILKSGMALSYIQIKNKLVEMGDLTIDAPTADAIMIQMMRNGDVIRQEGGTWKRK